MKLIRTSFLQNISSACFSQREIFKKLLSTYKRRYFVQGTSPDCCFWRIINEANYSVTCVIFNLLCAFQITETLDITWKDRIRTVENKIAKNIRCSYYARYFMRCIINLQYAYFHRYLICENLTWRSTTVL